MKIDYAKTAVLTLDIQEGILGFAPGAAATAIPNAGRVAEAARKSGCLLIHVGIGFEQGYPEISPDSPRFAMIKERGGFIKGSESAKTHREVFKPGDIVLYKNRVSAFSGSPLEVILRARGIKTLVLMGIATSGIVLSTLRQASDMDYQCIVVKDACYDADDEVHRVLTEKVFTRQATVVTTLEFLANFV
jgi:nicotinamidase-related amidase